MLQICRKTISIEIILVFFFAFALNAQMKEAFVVPKSSSNVSFLLKKASSFEKREKWSKAIECYEKIIESYRDRLALVEESSKHRLYQNACQLTMQRLESLPKEAREIYGKVIRRQIKNFDLNRMSKLEFQRILTSEDNRTLLWALDSCLAREEYCQTLGLIFRYARGKNKRDNAVLARKGFCFYALGYKNSLLKLQKNTSGEVIIEGKRQTLSEYFFHLLSQIEKQRKSLNTEEWPFYGNSAHTFSSDDEISELAGVKTVPIEAAKRQKLEGVYYNQTIGNATGPCPYYPVIAEGMVFINNGKSVFAYDLYTGKQKWRYKGLISILQSVYHEQVVHGATYDRGALYVNIEGATPTQKRDKWSNYQIRSVIAERKLIKLNAATGEFLWQVRDLKGDEEAFGNKASFMTPPVVWGNLLFTGATELEGAFNSYVVAIDPKNGAILWKTLIGYAQQELNMFGRPVREAVGGMVAAGNGMLYHLTNLGACCCVDPLTGQLLWVYVYDRLPSPRYDQALYQTRYRKASWQSSPVILDGDSVYIAPLDSENLYCLDAASGQVKWQRQRHSNNRYLMAVTDGKVILGGSSIEFLDAKNGNRLKNILIYPEVKGMGIVTKGHFYCPTTRYLYCIDIDNYKSKRIPWPFPEHQAGHMAIADAIAVTTSFNANKKRAYLNVFCDPQKIRRKWEAQLKNNPDSPALLLHLANLYSHTNAYGSWDKKIEDLYKKSYAAAKSLSPVYRRRYQEKARQGLVEVFLKMAEEEERHRQYDEAFRYYAKILDYAREPDIIIAVILKQYRHYLRLGRDKKARKCLRELIANYGNKSFYNVDTRSTCVVAVHALALLAATYRQSGQYEDAAEIYQSILERYPNKVYEGISAHKWAFLQIREMITSRGQKIYAKYDKHAQKEFQRLVKEQASSTDYIRIIEGYPNSIHIPEMMLQRANCLLQEQKIKEAAEVLKYLLREFSQSPQAPQISRLLVECYESLKMYSAAKSTLEQMENMYGENVIIVGDREISVLEFTEKRLSTPVYAGIQTQIVPRLNLWKSDNPKYQIPFNSRNLLRLLEVYGYPSSKAKRLVFFNLGADRFTKKSKKGVLYCYDGETAKLLWSARLGWVRRVGFIDDSLFVWGNHNIFSLDPQSGKTIWEKEIFEHPTEHYRFVSLTLGKNILAYVCSYFDKDYSTIIVRDAKTGKMLWTANFPGSDPEDILLGNQTLIAYCRKPSAVYIYNLSSGKLLKRFEDLKERRSNLWRYYPSLPCENYMCIVSDKRWLECYQLPALKLLWRYDGENIDLKSLKGGEDYICFMGKGNQIVLLELIGGDVKWSRQMQEQSEVHEIIPDSENLFILEKSGEMLYLSALNTHNGSLKWQTLLTDEYNRVVISPLLTRKYILVLKNRSVEGIQSILDVYDKFSGKKMRHYEVKRGGRGRTECSMCVSAGYLWLVKDNLCWVLGK